MQTSIIFFSAFFHLFLFFIRLARSSSIPFRSTTTNRLLLARTIDLAIFKKKTQSSLRLQRATLQTNASKNSWPYPKHLRVTRKNQETCTNGMCSWVSFMEQQSSAPSIRDRSRLVGDCKSIFHLDGHLCG